VGGTKKASRQAEGLGAQGGWNYSEGRFDLTAERTTLPAEKVGPWGKGKPRTGHPLLTTKAKYVRKKDRRKNWVGVELYSQGEDEVKEVGEAIWEKDLGGKKIEAQPKG